MQKMENLLAWLQIVVLQKKKWPRKESVFVQSDS